jgi:circadian clock protein KaiB
VCIQYTLKLYVTGRTPRSMHALSTLQRICATRLEGLYTIDLIDVKERPEMAIANNILMTPTVIKERPLPERRVVGDLSHEEDLVVSLGLHDPREVGELET